MRNGWTGGQYSLFRAGFGLYIAIDGLQRLSFSNHLPDEVTFLIWTAIAAAVPFIIGYHDKAAALWICLAFLGQSGPDQLISESLVIVLLLLVHMALPAAPYGAYGARKRVDPGGSWQFPEMLYLFTWLLLAGLHLGRSGPALIGPLLSLVSGPENAGVDVAAAYINQATPITWLLVIPVLELLLSVMFLVRRLRSLAWVLLAVLQIVEAVLPGPGTPVGGMLVLHALTFNPLWIGACPRAGAPALLFYDGNCGLCHGAVRFLLAEDQDLAFRFAPLQSVLFSQTLSEKQRSGLPDSIVLRTHDAAVLTRSEAVIYAMIRLGGIWRLAGVLSRLVPRPVRDAVYTAIASIRHRLFARPAEACPLAPPHLRLRFWLEDNPPDGH